MHKSDSLHIMVHEYRVNFKGGRAPHILITLNKKEAPITKAMIAEFVNGAGSSNTSAEIGFSTDEISETAAGKLSIGVLIESYVTDNQKKMFNTTDNAPVTCSITSSHQANAVNAMYDNSLNKIGSGGKISITITDHAGKVLCVLKSAKVYRFSWAEKFREINSLAQGSQGKKTN